MTERQVSSRRTFRPRTCEICGEQFAPRSGSQKYCKDECREQGEKATRARWEAENAERLRQAAREYRASHADRTREVGKEYRDSHREEIAERMRGYYEQHAEELRQYRRDYYEENGEIERARVRAAIHRARTPDATADFTAEDDLILRAATKYCPLCGCELNDQHGHPNARQIDHIVPVAVGGTHTHGNVRVICRKCNRGRPLDGSDLSTTKED